MAVNNRSSRSAKAIALEGKSAETRAKIAEIQLRLKIEDDGDPLFWMMMAQGTFCDVFLDGMEQMKSAYSEFNSEYRSMIDAQNSEHTKITKNSLRAAKSLSESIPALEQIKSQIEAVQRRQNEDRKVYIPMWMWASFVAWIFMSALFGFVFGTVNGRVEDAQKVRQEAIAERWGSLENSQQWENIEVRCVPLLGTGQTCEIPPGAYKPLRQPE